MKRKDKQRLLLPPGVTSTTAVGCRASRPRCGHEVRGPLRLADFPMLPKRADGWWLHTPFEGDDGAAPERQFGKKASPTSSVTLWCNCCLGENSRMDHIEAVGKQ